MYSAIQKGMAASTISIPVQVQVKANTREAYAESLRMILQHVADFHITVVDIISEKYNIPVNEIMNTVTSDSRYTDMNVDPKIHRLTVHNETCSKKKIKIKIKKNINATSNYSS